MNGRQSCVYGVDLTVRAFVAALAGLLCWLAAPCSASAQESHLDRLTLHFGFTRSSFRNVNASDATTALRIFAQTAARKRGYEMVVDVRLFDKPADCAAEIKNGHINMAILDTWDYLGMDIQSNMEPVFVELEQGAIFKEYLLLTHKDSGLTNLASLRGKDLMILEGKGGNISRAWLDCLLLQNHFDPKELFFGKLEPVGKPAAAVLPVFFNTRPACMVDRTAFQIMAELNPQVGQNLVATAVSDPYLENITCISRSGWPSERQRKDLIQGMAELHLDPCGQQVLELFKIDQLVPFKEEYLNSARKLQRNLAISPGSQAKR